MYFCRTLFFCMHYSPTLANLEKRWSGLTRKTYTWRVLNQSKLLSLSENDTAAQQGSSGLRYGCMLNISPFFSSSTHSPFINNLLLWCLNRTLRNLHYSSPFLLHIVTSGITRLSVSLGCFSCPCCSCRKGFSSTPSTQVHICPSMCWEEIQPAPKGYLGFLGAIVLSKWNFQKALNFLCSLYSKSRVSKQ